MVDSAFMYCDVCRKKALSKDEKDMDMAYSNSEIILFNGSIDIGIVRAFLDKHDNCANENDHIVFDVAE